MQPVLDRQLVLAVFQSVPIGQTHLLLLSKVLESAHTQFRFLLSQPYVGGQTQSFTLSSQILVERHSQLVLPEFQFCLGGQTHLPLLSEELGEIHSHFELSLFQSKVGRQLQTVLSLFQTVPP